LAKQEADYANRSKSIFLANVSHELRSPLGSILGFARMGSRDASIPEIAKENLAMISRAGEHLLTLINDILDMAKIEAGHATLELSDFDFHELLHEVVEMMQIRAVTKGLLVVLRKDSHLPGVVRADSAKLRQILINLLSNAIKFTRRGEVNLYVDFHPDNEGGLELLGEVHDTGIGIPADCLETIFLPFEQVSFDRQPLSKQQGTGLGLAITKQYVEMMGGWIKVESEADKGSIFRFALEIETGDPQRIVDTDLTEGVIGGLAPGQPDYRILVAEDEPESALLLRRILEEVGFQVRVAGNGKECVKLFKSWSPHWIWMDKRMPVLDGVEAMKRIYALPGGGDTKIALITAAAGEADKEMLDKGFVDIVHKPYWPERIFESMSKHLGVRFTGKNSAESPGEHVQDLAVDRLGKLPKPLIDALDIAVRSLDVERTLELISKTESLDPSLAESMRGSVKTLEFEKLRLALAKTIGERQEG
jgi:CheY-like chemotaxis protein